MSDNPLYCIVCNKCYITPQGYNDHLTRGLHRKTAVNLEMMYKELRPDLLQKVKNASIKKEIKKK